MKNIPLDKSKSIVFMGSMNAFPMTYALQLKKYGYEVFYIVDVPKSDMLSRPENHYPFIEYPYPDWIIEWTLPLQIILLLSPKIFAKLLSGMLKKHVNKTIGCYVLNGFFISLSPYLPEVTRVALSHGSDLDVWANVDSVDELRKGIFQTKYTKIIPIFIQDLLLKNFIAKQKKGFQNSNFLNYMPPGYNKVGDKIVSNLQNDGVCYIPRKHASFASIAGQNRDYRENTSTLQIFSGVRFLYQSFPRGNTGYNKGNDKIIEGLARYYHDNQNISIHFVEKGTDLLAAKQLCKKLGLEAAITWHKEMPFQDLIALYQQSDICFDQVGDHCIGAIGIYALWFGKPLIADDTVYVDSGCWPHDNPVCKAKNPDDIFGWLCRLSDNEKRKKVSVASRIFADQHLDIEKFPNAMFQLT